MENSNIFLSMMLFIFLRIVLVSSNDRPIIGILAQEYDVQSIFPHIKADSYIAASYVKAVESSGARVVPIFINKTETYYRSIMKNINGVLLPGGGTILKPGNGYYDAAAYINQIALEFNHQGLYFPLFGICLGFEALLVLANNQQDPQIACHAVHQNYPLVFEEDPLKTLQYSKIDEDSYFSLKNSSITYNNHKWCTTPEIFESTGLSKNWKKTSTSTDSNGLKFISSVEHKKFPILGVQFHPEKNIFEWKTELNINHSESAVKVNRYFFDFFVNLARKNNNHYESETAELADLIYNYEPLFAESKWSFEQVYVFSENLNTNRLMYFSYSMQIKNSNR